MNPHLAIIRKNRYLEGLYAYGFYTLCYLINEYENENNYEECQIILDALNEHNKYMKDDLPTKFDDDAKEYFKKSIQKFGLTGDLTLRNTPFYADEVKKMVNKTVKIK